MKLRERLHTVAAVANERALTGPHLGTTPPVRVAVIAALAHRLLARFCRRGTHSSTLVSGRKRSQSIKAVFATRLPGSYLRKLNCSKGLRPIPAPRQDRPIVSESRTGNNACEAAVSSESRRNPSSGDSTLVAHLDSLRERTTSNFEAGLRCWSEDPRTGVAISLRLGAVHRFCIRAPRGYDCHRRYSAARDRLRRRPNAADG